MSSFCKVSVPTPSAGGHNAEYITREEAVLEFEDGYASWGLPDEVTQHEDCFPVLRSHLVAWCTTRCEEEIDRHGNRRGRPRTHYRAVLSFERDVDTRLALEMTGEWLEEVAPGCRAFATMHRDTDNPHVHVWIDARKRDGKKISWSKKAFRNLDVEWGQIYNREIARIEADEKGHGKLRTVALRKATELARNRELIKKKEETQAHKVALAKYYNGTSVRARMGMRPPSGPDRNGRRPTPEEGRQRRKRAAQNTLAPKRVWSLDQARQIYQRAYERAEAERKAEQERLKAERQAKEERREKERVEALKKEQEAARLAKLERELPNAHEYGKEVYQLASEGSRAQLIELRGMLEFYAERLPEEKRLEDRTLILSCGDNPKRLAAMGEVIYSRFSLPKRSKMIEGLSVYRDRAAKIAKEARLSRSSSQQQNRGQDWGLDL